MKIIQTDDKITIRANKIRTDGTKKQNIKFTERHELNSSRTEIYKYWNRKSGKESEYINPKEYNELIHHDWVACKIRNYNTKDENIKIFSRDNGLYIQLSKLSTSSRDRILSSRYKNLLEVITEAVGTIFEYKPKAMESDRNKIEASRQNLKRKWSLYEYEYNIYIIDKEKGRELFEALKGSQIVEYENTIYLSGYGLKGDRKEGISVKMYNAGVKHEKQFKNAGDVYKIEITIRKKQFDKLKIDIKDMNFMENCISRVKLTIIKEIIKLKERAGDKMNFILEEITESENILSRIIKVEQEQLESKRAIEEVINRVNALEKEIIKNRK
jgi:hypothetical protein